MARNFDYVFRGVRTGRREPGDDYTVHAANQRADVRMPRLKRNTRDELLRDGAGLATGNSDDAQARLAGGGRKGDDRFV
jgi:hypothetical protein